MFVYFYIKGDFLKYFELTSQLYGRSLLAVDPPKREILSSAISLWGGSLNAFRIILPEQTVSWKTRKATKTALSI